MPSYTPSFVNPITRDLKVSNTLTASIAQLATVNAPVINSSTGTFNFLNVSTGSFTNLTVTENLNIPSISPDVIHASTGTFVYLDASSGSIAELSATTLVSSVGSITELSSSTGTFVYLDALTGSIAELSATTLVASVGSITELSSSTGTFVYLDASSGSIAELSATTLVSSVGSITELSSSTGTFVYLDASSGSIAELSATTLVASSGTISELSSSTGSFVYLDALTGTVAELSVSTFLAATNAAITTLSSASGTFEYLSASTGTITELTSTTIHATTVYADSVVTPVVPGSDSFWNGWFQVTNKAVIRAIWLGGNVGPAGYDMAGNNLRYYTKYIFFDSVSQYPNILVKFYPVLFDQVFEQAYTEYTYSHIDADTISYQYGPNTDTFDLTEAMNVFNSTSEFTYPITFQKQGDGSVCVSLALAGNYINTNRTMGVLLPAATDPTIIPYSALAVKSESFATPIALFNLMDDYAQYNYYPLNPAFGKNTYFDSIGRKNTIKKAYLEGITYQYDVNHVQISTTANTEPTYYSQSVNGVTRINFSEPHFVTEGSTIEISGFVGDWDVMNGTYVNDVNFSYSRKQPLTDNNHTVRASMVNYCHGFDLIFDSHALPAQTTGATKGYGIYSGSPVVSVTHHIQDDMSYNNFVAALKAYIMEAYGTTDHGYITALYQTADARIADDWDASVGVDTRDLGLQSYSSQEYTPMACDILYNNFFEMNEFWLASDPFDMLATFQTIPDAANGFQVTANYLTGTSYNLWWAITGTNISAGSDGADMAGAWQTDTCSYFGVSPAGNEIVLTHAARGSTPPGSGWYIFGGGPYDDPATSYVKNFLTFGIIHPDLTNVGQKVGLINVSSNLGVSTDFTYVWGQTWTFYPLGQDYTSTQALPDPSINGLLALPIGYIMRWFAAEGVTDIILNNAQNDGGWIGWITQHLGENRKAIINQVVQPLTDNQRGTTTLLSDYTFSQAPVPAGLSEVQCSFLNTTYGAGTVWNSGKVAVLYSDVNISAAVIFRLELLGDDRDGVIGACQVKHLGNCKGFSSSVPAGQQKAVDTVMHNLSTGALAVGLAGEGPDLYTSVDGAGQLYNVSHLDAASDMSPNSSSLKGPGNAWVSSFEQLIYPDFGFSENTRPVLPGYAGPQQPTPSDPTTWRYAYLEEAIKEIKLTW